jgi:hypothetical protein
MNPHDEALLEQQIHKTLRAQPARRAPRSLEQRVLAAIAERQALPWYRRAPSHWPMQARLMAGLSTAALIAMTSHRASSVEAATPESIGWLESLGTALFSSFSTALQSIPAPYLYGSLAMVASCYLACFGLGATAYRTLLQNR